MTKERKLAIEMWTNIRDMLSASDGQSPEDITEYKEIFCRDHGLNWINSCWFCQYMMHCGVCPLHSCKHGSNYAHVIDSYWDKDARVAACNSIIRALMGGKI